MSFVISFKGLSKLLAGIKVTIPEVRLRFTITVTREDKK